MSRFGICLFAKKGDWVLRKGRRKERMRMKMGV